MTAKCPLERFLEWVLWEDYVPPELRQQELREKTSDDDEACQTEDAAQCRLSGFCPWYALCRERR
jgi:hypothetical protein